MPGSSFPSTPSGLQSSPFLKGNEDFRLCHPFLKLLLPTPHQQFQVSWSLVLEDTQIWLQFLPTNPGEQGEEEPVDGGVLLGLGEAVPPSPPPPQEGGQLLPGRATHQHYPSVLVLGAAVPSKARESIPEATMACACENVGSFWDSCTNKREQAGVPTPNSTNPKQVGTQQCPQIVPWEPGQLMLNSGPNPWQDVLYH